MFKSCPVLGKVLPADARAAGSKRTQEMKTVCHGSTLSKDLSEPVRVPAKQGLPQIPAQLLRQKKNLNRGAGRLGWRSLITHGELQAFWQEAEMCPLAAAHPIHPHVLASYIISKSKHSSPHPANWSSIVILYFQQLQIFHEWLKDYPAVHSTTGLTACWGSHVAHGHRVLKPQDGDFSELQLQIKGFSPSYFGYAYRSYVHTQWGSDRHAVSSLGQKKRSWAGWPLEDLILIFV